MARSKKPKPEVQEDPRSTEGSAREDLPPREDEGGENVGQVLLTEDEDSNPKPLTEGYQAPVGEDVPGPEVQPVPAAAREKPPEAVQTWSQTWWKKGDKSLRVEVLKHHHGLALVRDVGGDGTIYNLQIDDLEFAGDAEAAAERLQAPFPVYGPGVEAPYDAHGAGSPDADPVAQPSALDQSKP